MFKVIAASALVLCLAAPVFAQQAQTPHLDKRQAKMENRIEKGKASGALTEKEAARVEKRQEKLGQAEQRAKSDGVVTGQERRHLDKKADKLSKDIHRQKHDTQTDAAAQ